ncbi:MAG: hypothetical protein AB7N61_23750 [Acidimicrobiia bacterium]
MSHETIWYITRSSAMTAWFFLTLTVVWGSFISGRFVRRKGAQRYLNDLHPYLGALGLTALVIHLVTAVTNSYVGLNWVSAIVPFAASWRPGGITAGVAALWLLVAVEGTSLARRRMKRQTWHRIHLGAYAMAWITALHAVMVGTDLQNPVVAWGALALVAASTGVAAARSFQADRHGNTVTASHLAHT